MPIAQNSNTHKAAKSMRTVSGALPNNNTALAFAGLHFDDIRRLLDVLQRLVDNGNTVLVIEHNLDVIKCADWVVDLGPGGGELGGHLIAEGTPEKVAQAEGCYTGQYLQEVLNGSVANDDPTAGT